jgi:hypothetical protein
MDNFKPTAEELQAELDELQAHEVSLPVISVQPEIKVYLLMKNGFLKGLLKDLRMLKKLEKQQIHNTPVTHITFL